MSKAGYGGGNTAGAIKRMSMGGGVNRRRNLLVLHFLETRFKERGEKPCPLGWRTQVRDRTYR